MAGMTPTRRRLTDVVKRWPTALAVALAALMVEGGRADSAVETYGESLPLLPLLYLTAAKLQRRRASWPLLIVGIAAIMALRVLDVIAPSIVFVAVASIVLVWSVPGFAIAAAVIAARGGPGQRRTTIQRARGR